MDAPSVFEMHQVQHAKRREHVLASLAVASVVVATALLGWFAAVTPAEVLFPPPAPLLADVLPSLAQAKPAWRYGPPTRTDEAARALLGGRAGSLPAQAPWRRGAYVPDALPPAFDARSRWPECAATLWHIRDQSQCGDCWAFGSVTAFNDRVCIASGGVRAGLLSPSDLVACCTPENGCANSHGCKGGEATDAFVYFRDYGLVSGGDYPDNGKNDTCWPYNLPEFHKHSGKHNYTAPTCRDTCTNDYPTRFAADKVYASSAYSLGSVEEIKRDLMAHGPVACSYDVYQDFMLYKGGVYQHHVGKLMDGHVVRILGWGLEHGTEYWIAANSWNIWWGESGFFRIKIGNSNISAPGTCIAGEPRV